MYLIFGGLTTVVSFVFYFLSSWVFGLPAWLSSVVSWIFAVTFAFITNKIYVFRSETKTKESTIKEAALFFGARLASMLINAAIMLVFVDWFDMNEPLFFLIGQIFVMIFNYVAAKLVIFRK